MHDAKLQSEIDRITWYHEFDFGGGLVAHSNTSDTPGHRRVWRFIETHLNGIDFEGKSVLDIGCWDGYWSFHAEKRGARHVLATDDVSQNWAAGEGIQLARRLLKSSIEIRQDVSVYNLQSLGRKFDIILCLGVFYHLLDPVYAFAQVRHCCHANTVVVFEGDVGRYGMAPGEVRYHFGDPTKRELVASEGAINGMLKSAYLTVHSQHWLKRHPDLPFGMAQMLLRIRDIVRTRTLRHWFNARRCLFVCSPFEGVNELHLYPPPFGLDLYDSRYRAGAAAKAA